MPFAAVTVTVAEVCMQVISVALAVINNGGVGSAIADVGGLVQPFTVCVTAYAPAVATVIELVVALLFHNNVPAAVADNVAVPSQLFITDTTGATGVIGCAIIVVLAAGDRQPSAFFIVTL